MTGYGFPTELRITVGTRAENERLLRALDTLRSGHGASPAAS